MGIARRNVDAHKVRGLWLAAEECVGGGEVEPVIAEQPLDVVGTCVGDRLHL